MLFSNDWIKTTIITINSKAPHVKWIKTSELIQCCIGKICYNHQQCMPFALKPENREHIIEKRKVFWKSK